jgi:tetratricopeptide (TPR) repeat protein
MNSFRKTTLKLGACLCFLIAGISGFGQDGAKMKELEVLLVKQLCDCLGTISSKSPEFILNEGIASCVRVFFQDKGEIMSEIALENESMFVDMSEYEVGRKIGVKLISNTINELVLTCPYYRKALIDFKKEIVNDIRTKRADIKEFILEMKALESALDDPSRRYNYYLFLGILYEFTEDKASALETYQLAMEISPSTVVKALYTLLQNEN